MRTVDKCSGSAPVLLLLLAPPTDVDAQTIGARIGVTKPNDKTGLTVGGFVAFALTRCFSVQPGLLYSEKGRSSYLRGFFTQYYEEDVFADMTLDQNIGYVELPLLVTLGDPRVNRFALSVSASPAESR